MLKKILIITTLLALTATPTFAATTNTFDPQATLHAFLHDSHDYIPPTPPPLIAPQGDICENRPTFRWQPSTDNIAVTHYNFKITKKSDGNAFFEVNNLSSDQETNDYNFWFDDSGYHLIIKKDLAYDKYTWQVTAVDLAGNPRSSSFDLNYLEEVCNPAAKCDTSPNQNFSLFSPSGTITNLSPPIRFNFDPTGTPTNFDVYVNDNLAFSSVPLSTVTTASYLVNVTNTSVLFQPRGDYLPLPTSSGGAVSYTIRVVLHDSNSCTFSANTTVNYGAVNAQCPASAPVPTLLSPPTNSEVGSLSPTLSWQVCGTPDCFNNFTVRVNNVTLPSNAISTNVNNLAPGCNGPGTIFTAPANAGGSVRYNNPSDPMDFNVWQVSVSATNGFTSSSSPWTFKVYQYYWCTATAACAAGSKAECGQSGARCFTARNECLAASALACATLTTGGLTPGEKPPSNLGGLTGDMGKNVNKLLDKFKNLDPAALLTSEFWNDVGDTASQIMADMVALGFFFFPVVSLLALLPIGILIIIFPQPKGFVFDSKTLKPVKNALLSLEMFNQTIRSFVNSDYGLYIGIKLNEGQYNLIVSREGYHFPSIVPRRKHQSVKNYYLGEDIAVKNYEHPVAVYIIPLDSQEYLDKIAELGSRAKADEKYEKPDFVDRARLFILRLVNSLFWLYGGTFTIVLCVTCVYPTWLNLFVLLIYLIGWFRRVFALCLQVNVVGKVESASGARVDETVINVKLLSGGGDAGSVQTNVRGEFSLFLHPGSIYELTAAGGETYTLEATRHSQKITLKVA